MGKREYKVGMINDLNSAWPNRPAGISQIIQWMN